MLFRSILTHLSYYNDRDKWVKMMKTSINSTKEYFGVKRMLDEYYERMYIKPEAN